MTLKLEIENVKFELKLKLFRFSSKKYKSSHLFQAAALCRKNNFPSQLATIGRRCVQELDIELAISAYRECGHYDKVLLLQRHRHIEHLPSLAGYMALADDQPQLACEWFTRAGDHSAALDIHTDLMEWEKAIALAEVHAPEKISHARLQHAAQLELLGDHAGALANYERALATRDAATADPAAEKSCTVGMAKAAMRLGDVPRGLALCRELREDKGVLEECAGILEEGRHFKDAARLYRQCGNVQKAAAMFLRAKEWKQVISGPASKTVVVYVVLALPVTHSENEHTVFRKRAHRVPKTSTPCSENEHTVLRKRAHRVPKTSTPCSENEHTVFRKRAHRVPKTSIPSSENEHTLLRKRVHRSLTGHSNDFPKRIKAVLFRRNVFWKSFKDVFEFVYQLVTLCSSFCHY